MKKNVKLLIGIIVAVVVIVGGIIGFKVYSDLQQEEILDKEMKIVENLDIEKDDYNRPIKTKGDYAVVEKTVKNYLSDFQKTLLKTSSLMEDKRLVNMLSAQNYKNDGPEFKESLKYIEETSKELETLFDKLIDMCDEKTIMAAIEKENLSDYYVDLYKEVAIGDVSDDFKEVKKEYEDSKEKMLELLKLYDNVLNFLKKNKGKWQVQGDNIVFNSQSLLTTYNGYLSSLNKLVSK